MDDVIPDECGGTVGACAVNGGLNAKLFDILLFFTNSKNGSFGHISHICSVLPSSLLSTVFIKTSLTRFETEYKSHYQSDYQMT